MKRGERAFRDMPRMVLAGFIVMLLVQLGYHHGFKSSSSDDFQQLDPPGPVGFYRVLSLGSDQLLSYLLLLGVQLHDNQKGRHVNYVHLDYAILSDWLQTVYALNAQSDYPAFLATRVYSQVRDETRVRRMVGLVDALFDSSPQRHWRRMTEACLLAKHQLHDLPLALALARKIAALPKSVNMPYWARDMQIILLDELNQLESAQLLISSLLQSGEVKDPDEIRFLEFRLLKIQQTLLKNGQMAD